MINIYYLEKDNIPFYVGKTNNPTDRLKNHKKKLGNNNITLVVIDNINDDEWKFWESYWIHQFKSWGFNLTNKNKGGGGPERYTEEQKQKMRKPKPKGFGEKISKYQKGSIKPRSEQHRINLSKSTKGRNNEWNYKTILQYDLEGNFIKEWSSLKEAGNELKIQRSSISYCLLKKYKTAGGFVWQYKN